jgi:hypothetical protein
MTLTLNQKTLIEYSPLTLKRAKRALRCSFFQLKFFKTMTQKSISLNEVTGEKGQNQGYIIRNIRENKAESELMWLIKVGILRREVDGQGITDSFRLTPLGKLIIHQKELENNHKLTFWDYLINTLNRWFNW